MAKITLPQLADKIANPERLLTQIGALSQIESRNSFREQRFGKEKWPRPYPRQTPPRINTAMALFFANQGKSIPDRLLNDKLANVDMPGTGLSASISFRVVNDSTVEVGSNLPFASKANFGGVSSIPVTKEGKKGLGKFIRKKPKFSKKLGFLFGESRLTIISPGRPFLGVTKRLEKKIQLAIQEFFSHG